MRKNVAGQLIGAQITSLNGNPFTGSVEVYVTGDNGAQALGTVGSGICTHKGNGYHSYTPAQAETNFEHIAFTFIGAGCVPVTLQIYTGLNVRWMGGLPVVPGDVSVALVSMISRLSGSLPIFWGEDHLAADGRALLIDGIVDSLADAVEATLTIKDSEGTKIVEDLITVDIDDIEKTIRFDMPATTADDFDLEEAYFFFCQIENSTGSIFTVKRGSVELLDTAESTVPL